MALFIDGYRGSQQQAPYLTHSSREQMHHLLKEEKKKQGKT
jgi:hypothetical protein